MSEALVVIGAVAAFAQLTKYGAGLARIVLDCPSDLRGIPSTVKDLIEHLDWHRTLVQSLALKDTNGATTPCVHRLISRSHRIASSLQELLTPLLPSEGEPKTRRLHRVFSYQRRIRKITKYRTELESCERRLILHFSALTYQNTHHDAVQAISPPTTLRGTPVPPGILVNLPPRSAFIGRDSSLDLISRTLVAPGNRACLFGVRGAGKSATAKECVYRLHHLYPEISVIWIDTRDRFAVQTSYDRLFPGENLSANVITPITTIHDLLVKLDTVWSGRWMLIVDDIHSGANGDPVLRQLACLPIRNGSILFTTRNMHTALLLADHRFIFPLDPMTLDEATQLLKTHVDGRNLSNEDLDSMLGNLDYHPLAIIQAGESMRVHSLSAAQHVEVLRPQEDNDCNFFPQVHSSCYRTFSLLDADLFAAVSMRSLYDHNDDAAQLLAVIACLGNARLPLALFDDTYSASELITTLSFLRASSLVVINDIDKTLTIPGFVRLSVRASLRQHRIYPAYALRALQLVSQTFPENGEQYSMLTKCGLCLPHALFILEEYMPQWASVDHHCSRLTTSSNNRCLPIVRYQDHLIDPIDSAQGSAAGSQGSSSWDIISSLALRVSHFLGIIGQYESALKFAVHALKWVSNANYRIPSPSETFLCESSIANLSHYLGRPTMFASQVEQLFLSQTVLLKSHRPLTIRALRSKALALQAQGHHGQAEGYHRRAIAICTSIYGYKDTKLLDEKHGLALSILGQGRAQEALGTFYDIYKVMEATLSLSNPKTLSVLANIGCALQHLSQWTEAYKVMTRALSGRKAVLGEDHPHTIQSRANLAQIYVASGDMAGAERITKETLQIHVAKLGEDHHLSLHILNNLGYLFLERDRYTEAAEVLHRVTRKRETVLGSQHCDTLTSMFYACEAYWRMGRLEEAFELGHRVLNGRRSLNDGDASMREIEERLAEIERDRWLELMR